MAATGRIHRGALGCPAVDLPALVHAADPDALLGAVDDLAAAGDWDGLVELGQRCRAAVEVGRQLWGVALHVDYRLALEAPPPVAAAVLGPGTGRFTLGPLPEVAASRATWAALAPHLSDPVTAAAVAAERVVRGEDVAAAGHPLPPVDLPLALQSWEPAYAVATYRDRSASFPQPDLGRPVPAARAASLRPGRRLPDEEAVAALRAVVEVWTSDSRGTVRAVAVEGDAGAAVGRLLTDTQRPARAALTPVPGAAALAQLQWAGASGGALGRRRGGAAGRFAAWWAATMLVGLDWPVDPGELGSGVGELSWVRWDAAGPDGGWTLRLAVADPADGLGWAVEAVDVRDDDVAAT